MKCNYLSLGGMMTQFLNFDSKKSNIFLWALIALTQARILNKISYEGNYILIKLIILCA